MIQFIKNNKPYSQTDREDLIQHYLSIGCVEVDVLYNENFISPIWNGSEFIEGATAEEIEQANKPIVPETISAMALKIQLFDLGISDQDIYDDIDSVPDSMFPINEKMKAKIKYNTATKFDRNNADVNLIATMEGLSQDDLDQIFINGNNY